jgi:excisionase family DNA binding protein
MMGNNASRWFSVEEIANHLGIKRDTLYKWIQRKELPAHKVGRLWKFKINEVDEWVRSGRAKDIPPGKEKTSIIPNLVKKSK